MRPLLAAIFLWALACGDDEAPGDASTDGAVEAAVDATTDGDSGGLTPTTPTEPAPPVLTPCPSGWREVATADGPTFCDPYPDGLERCPLTESHLPGTASCAAITAPCPADGFPSDVPEATVLYVRAGAPAGGDGSRTAPFTTLEEAIGIAPDGAAIAIAPGTYGPAVVSADVALRGACADVIITSTGRAPALAVENATASVDNLRVSGADNAIRVIASDVSLSRLIVDDAQSVGVSVVGGTANASRVRLHGAGASGIFVAPDASFVGSELAFTGEIRVAVRAASSSTVVRDAVFALTDADSEVYFGNDEDQATFERVAVVGDGSMLALGRSALTLRDASLLGTPAPSAPLSTAIAGFEGARITIERTSHRRSWSFALAVAEAESALSVTDVVIRGEAEGALHDAIEVGEGANAVLSRVHIEGARSIGVLATEAETSVSAGDLTILDTRPDTTGVYGRALQVQRSASFVGRQVHVAGSHEVAVVAAVDAEVTFEDLVLVETRERGCAAEGCESGGIGLGAYLRGHISATRFRVSTNALAGAQLALDGEIDLVDGAVTDNPVGVNVQVPGYDLSRLMDRVYFRDNGINLDSEELPLPPATTPP